MEMAIELATCEASEAPTCVLLDATPGTAGFYRKLHFTSATVTDFQRSVPIDCPTLLLIFVFPILRMDARCGGGLGGMVLRGSVEYVS